MFESERIRGILNIPGEQFTGQAGIKALRARIGVLPASPAQAFASETVFRLLVSHMLRRAVRLTGGLPHRHPLPTVRSKTGELIEAGQPGAARRERYTFPILTEARPTGTAADHRDTAEGAVGSRSEAKRYRRPTQTACVNDGEEVHAGDVPVKILREIIRTKGITGALPEQVRPACRTL